MSGTIYHTSNMRQWPISLPKNVLFNRTYLHFHLALSADFTVVYEVDTGGCILFLTDNLGSTRSYHTSWYEVHLYLRMCADEGNDQDAYLIKYGEICRWHSLLFLLYNTFTLFAGWGPCHLVDFRDRELWDTWCPSPCSMSNCNYFEWSPGTQNIKT